MVAQRASGVPALVIGEQVRKANGYLGPFAIFLIPAARNAQYAGHCHVAGSVEFNPAMAGGRMDDNAIGIDLTRLRQAPGCGKQLETLPAPQRPKLAAMLGVLPDRSLTGRLITESRRPALANGCGPRAA